MILFKPKTYSNKFLPLGSDNLFVQTPSSHVPMVKKIKHLIGPFYQVTSCTFLADYFLPTEELINPNPFVKINIEIDALQKEIDFIESISDYESPIITPRKKELEALKKQRDLISR